MPCPRCKGCNAEPPHPHVRASRTTADGDLSAGRLNEFLYAPHGIVKCSTGPPKFDTLVSLGSPDIKGNGPADLDLWLYRDLEPIGHALARRVTLQSWARSQWQSRAYSGYRNGANWLEKEIVAGGPKGQLWYIAGEPGVCPRVSQPAHVSLVRRLTTVSSWRCGAHRLHCVASEARFLAWARDWATILSSVAILAALFARICSVTFRGSIDTGLATPVSADT